MSDPNADNSLALSDQESKMARGTESSASASKTRQRRMGIVSQSGAQKTTGNPGKSQKPDKTDGEEQRQQVYRFPCVERLIQKYSIMLARQHEKQAVVDQQILRLTRSSENLSTESQYQTDVVDSLDNTVSNRFGPSSSPDLADINSNRQEIKPSFWGGDNKIGEKSSKFKAMGMEDPDDGTSPGNIDLITDDTSATTVDASSPPGFVLQRDCSMEVDSFTNLSRSDSNLLTSSFVAPPKSKELSDDVVCAHSNFATSLSDASQSPSRSASSDIAVDSAVDTKLRSVSSMMKGDVSTNKGSSNDNSEALIIEEPRSSIINLVNRGTSSTHEVEEYPTKLSASNIALAVENECSTKRICGTWQEVETVSLSNERSLGDSLVHEDSSLRNDFLAQERKSSFNSISGFAQGEISAKTDEYTDEINCMRDENNSSRTKGAPSSKVLDSDDNTETLTMKGGDYISNFTQNDVTSMKREDSSGSVSNLASVSASSDDNSKCASVYSVSERGSASISDDDVLNPKSEPKTEQRNPLALSDSKRPELPSPDSDTTPSRIAYLEVKPVVRNKKRRRRSWNGPSVSFSRYGTTSTPSDTPSGRFERKGHSLDQSIYRSPHIRKFSEWDASCDAGTLQESIADDDLSRSSTDHLYCGSCCSVDYGSRRESNLSSVFTDEDPDGDPSEGLRYHYLRTPSVVVSDHSDDPYFASSTITLEEIEQFRAEYSRHQHECGYGETSSECSGTSSCSLRAFDCDWLSRRKPSDCSTCSTLSGDDDSSCEQILQDVRPQAKVKKVLSQFLETYKKLTRERETYVELFPPPAAFRA